ncbi:MAG TPA: Uma2 family endonuclease [Gemmatimonadaceae bacterium]|nr:Uma2 family endonuclease [Gemmatimonadaceae bacterium]
MGMPALQRRWTADDVSALIDDECAWPRYELLDGELLVTPAPEPSHQFIVGEVFAMLHAYLEREPIGIAFTSPADIRLHPESLLQPDVFIVPAGTRIAGKRLRWPDVKSLLLAVEILSPCTARDDRVRKRDFYLNSGVGEYWIVDSDARLIERWTPLAERPELIRDHFRWSPPGAKPLDVDVAARFERLIKTGALPRLL